jgi:ATP-binding cassette subfamily F protein uup
VTHGSKLKVAYFDQHRGQLDHQLSVAENVHPSGEMVTVDGKARHILSYLQDFLFTPQTARAPVSKLSGGEKARLLLARLFLEPANVLVLDEPTNDLDIETVELLEERLLGYTGTLLLVSHDRSFLDNVVTSIIALQGNGQVEEFVGGCEDWLEAQSSPAPAKKAPPDPSPPARPPEASNAGVEPARRITLSNKQREALTTLPKKIEALEHDHAALSEQMASSAYYRDAANDPAADAARIERLETEILEAYEALEALEELKGN